MSLRSRVRTWWRAVVRGGEMSRQVQEELAFHIESYAAELEGRGMAREEALRRARAELGSVAARREDCRRAWGAQWFDELRGDVRYALRMLGRSPGFALLAVGSLALGIGVNTVIFTAAQHMLLDRLAVPYPGELRLLEWLQPSNNGVVADLWGWWDDHSDGNSVSTSFSYPVYEQLRRQNKSMEELFAFKPLGGQTVTVNGKAGSAGCGDGQRQLFFRSWTDARGGKTD